MYFSFTDGKYGTPEVILNQDELAERFVYVGVSFIKLSPSRKVFTVAM